VYTVQKRNKNITILDITNSDPSSNLGGIESVVYNLNKELIRRGFKVVTISYSNSDFYKETDAGIIIGKKVPQNEILRVIMYPIKVLLEARKHNADIIISEGPGNFGAGLLVNIFAKKHAIYLERAHGTHYGLIKYTPKKSLHMQILGRLIANIIERLQFKLADKCIAVSKLAEKELEQYFGILKSNIMVIYNGVDCKEFKPVNDEDRGRLRRELLIRKKCGVWVGGTDPYRKGLDIVLQIAKYMKNVEFKIIGSDKDFQGKDNFKIDINDLKNVEFLGKITNGEKIKYYHACDFLIFPSRHEGLAIAPMEALACGLPVIVSDMTGVNEIISNGVEGFIVDNKKLESYIKAITMVNKRMGKRARQLALKYDWKRQAGIYAKWFKELAVVNIA